MKVFNQFLLFIVIFQTLLFATTIDKKNKMSSIVIWNHYNEQSTSITTYVQQHQHAQVVT